MRYWQTLDSPLQGQDKSSLTRLLFLRSLPFTSLNYTHTVYCIEWLYYSEPYWNVIVGFPIWCVFLHIKDNNFKKQNVFFMFYNAFSPYFYNINCITCSLSLPLTCPWYGWKCQSQHHVPLHLWGCSCAPCPPTPLQHSSLQTQKMFIWQIPTYTDIDPLIIHHSLSFAVAQGAEQVTSSEQGSQYSHKQLYTPIFTHTDSLEWQINLTYRAMDLGR